MDSLVQMRYALTQLSGAVVLRSLAIALVYFAAAQLGLRYAVVGSTVTLLWLPSGIALIAILVYGYSNFVGVVLGAFLANAWTGVALPVVLAISIGNAIEAVVGAYLLLRCVRFNFAMSRRRDVFGLILLAAIASTLIAAVVGSSALLAADIVTRQSYPSVLMKWWLGDMMGVLVVAPPALALVSRSFRHFSAKDLSEALLLAILLIAVSYLIFATPELAGHGYYPASLAVFPFVIWGALRFDRWGASLVTLCVSIVAIWGTTHGSGPFASSSEVDSLVRWCIFVNVVAVTGLLLAASSAEQKRAQLELKISHDTLEERVRARTNELEQMNTGLQEAMAERKRLEAVLIRLSESQQKTIGQELHDGLGQHLTSVSLFCASLQQRVSLHSPTDAQALQRVVNLINQAVDMTRTISHGLYPVALESGGMVVALQQLVDNTNSSGAITCVLNAAKSVPIRDPLIEINLYRIAQEAVSNAVKHSGCKNIWIDFDYINGSHWLSVSDDGKGIDMAEIEQHDGLGMHSLRYRASLLKGEFSIGLNALSGTSIVVSYSAGARGAVE